MIQSRNTPTPGLPKLPPHHLHRPQLQAKLTDSDANLIALIAPAGYGKSVTLIDHALNANRSSAWVKVNPNLPRLVKATLNALHAIGLSGIGLSGIGLSDIGLESDPEDALEASLEQLETGIDLLFDGIDDLEPAANTWLLKLAQRLPDGHRLLLTARDAEHLRLERLTAEGRGELITAHDLAFAPGEGQSYLAARGLEPFDDLIDRLEGWPLALALAAAQIKNPSQTSSFTPEALLPEWLERLPFDVRSGLPEASVLEVWSEADAKEIGSTLPAGWLLEARRAGLPVVPNIDGASFVPHASLRQCLARQLLERPDRHRALHEAAIQSAIEAERFADAVRHALAAGLEERALEIAYGCAYIVSSRFNHRDFREIY